MQSNKNGPVLSDGPGFGFSLNAPYEALHEVTPFGLETPPPDPDTTRRGTPEPAAPPAAPEARLAALRASEEALRASAKALRIWAEALRASAETLHARTAPLRARLAAIQAPEPLRRLARRGGVRLWRMILRQVRALRSRPAPPWLRAIARSRLALWLLGVAKPLITRLRRLPTRRLPLQAAVASRSFWRNLQRVRRPTLTPAERAALRRNQQRRAAMELAFWLVLASGMVTLVVVALVCYYAMVLPNPRQAGLTRQPPNITILSANGEFLAERGMRRGYVTLDRTPRSLIDAVIATEDRRFHYHFGFDLIGLLRAAWTNWRAGAIVQGGSTLTQQLAKNLFLQPRRHWTRKFEELILALWLEAKFSKDQIMELYLNRVYFGSGNYGIEAAASHYFGKTTQELTLAESALLTGLIKAPSSLSPSHNPGGARERAAVVLRTMLETHLIGEADYLWALRHPAALQTRAPEPGFAYLIDWITELAPSLVGEAEGNFMVETTIDSNLQADVDALVRKMMTEKGEDLSAGEAAVVLMAPDGAVKTLVGGLDYDGSQFNRAVRGRRQPGSAFKPFLYLAALEDGMTPATLVEDAPIRWGDWKPQNHNGAYRGLIPLRTALAVSSNAVAVRLMQKLGRNKVIASAQKLGIYSDLDRGPTLALGTADVTPLELTAAYATFANGGYAVLPYVIRRVRNENGATLYEQSHARPQRVVSAAHVSEMNDMLNAVVATGTGAKAALPLHQAAGKTGTTQRFNDAWFVGYTAHRVAGIWVGNDRQRHMRHVTGGTLPAELWREIMARAHEGLPPRPLPGARHAAPEARLSAAPPQPAAVRDAAASDAAEDRKPVESRKSGEAKKPAEQKKPAESGKRTEPRDLRKPVETRKAADPGRAPGPTTPEPPAAPPSNRT